MGLFGSLFGKRADQSLSRHQVEANAMGAAVLQASGINFDSSAALEQALVGTFFFGMVTAHGMLHHLSPLQVHALALRAFVEEFHYSEAAAAQAAQSCIDVVRPGVHDTMNAILHRGIDGHRQHISGQTRALEENIQSVLAHFKAA